MQMQSDTFYYTYMYIHKVTICIHLATACTLLVHTMPILIHIHHIDQFLLRHHISFSTKTRHHISPTASTISSHIRSYKRPYNFHQLNQGSQPSPNKHISPQGYTMVHNRIAPQFTLYHHQNILKVKSAAQMGLQHGTQQNNPSANIQQSHQSITIISTKFGSPNAHTSLVHISAP